MDNQNEKKPKIEAMTPEPMSEDEKEILLKKVSEKLSDKMDKMTSAELEEWNDPWRHHRID